MSIIQYIIKYLTSIFCIITGIYIIQNFGKEAHSSTELPGILLIVVGSYLFVPKYFRKKFTPSVIVFFIIVGTYTCYSNHKNKEILDTNFRNTTAIIIDVESNRKLRSRKQVLITYSFYVDKEYKCLEKVENNLYSIGDTLKIQYYPLDPYVNEIKDF